MTNMIKEESIKQIQQERRANYKKYLLKHPDKYNQVIEENALPLILAAESFEKAKTEKSKTKYKLALINEIDIFKDFIADIDPESKYNATKMMLEYIARIERTL